MKLLIELHRIRIPMTLNMKILNRGHFSQKTKPALGAGYKKMVAYTPL
jgi:hypothetical protein